MTEESIGVRVQRMSMIDQTLVLASIASGRSGGRHVQRASHHRPVLRHGAARASQDRKRIHRPEAKRAGVAIERARRLVANTHWP